MSQTSPSLLFSQYTDLFCDQTWEDLFTELFGGPGEAHTWLLSSVSLCMCFSNQSCPAHLVSSHHTGSRLIMKDWHGIRPPVDATMVGRVILSPKPTSPPPRRRWSNRKRKPGRNRKQRRRQSRFVYFYDLWSYEDLFDDDFYTGGRATQQHQRMPVQNVYFFKKGMDIGLIFYFFK